MFMTGINLRRMKRNITNKCMKNTNTKVSINREKMMTFEGRNQD